MRVRANRVRGRLLGNERDLCSGCHTRKGGGGGAKGEPSLLPGWRVFV